MKNLKTKSISLSILSAVKCIAVWTAGITLITLSSLGLVISESNTSKTKEPLKTNDTTTNVLYKLDKGKCITINFNKEKNSSDVTILSSEQSFCTPTLLAKIKVQEASKAL